MKTTRIGLFASVLAGATLLAGQAGAATVSANFISSFGGSAAGNVQVVDPLLGGPTPLRGSGGLFTFQRTGGDAPPLVGTAPGQFIGICLELSENVHPTATYNFGDLEDAPDNGSWAPTMAGAGMHGTRADDMRYLLGRVFPKFDGAIINTTVAGITPQQAARALQLVVVFQNIWKTIGQNISMYKSYPRIVGETGGKDFIMAHSSADVHEVATAISRGAFEFQGQKCSAASRAYIPASIWPAVKERVIADLKSFKMGGTEDFTNFVNAVIDEKSFDKLAGYIDSAKKDKDVEMVAGGNYDKSKGYFIEPTVLLCKNPAYVTMCEELFGPVLSVFVYDDRECEKTLELVDKTGPYALTGAILAGDRYAIELATRSGRGSSVH